MLRKLLLISLLSISFTTYAQEKLEASGKYDIGTIEVSDKAPQDITVKYHVLKNAYNIRHGLYQAITKKKVVIATGRYENGKRVGTWHFYNSIGKLVQHYNYDKGRPEFLGNEDPSHNIVAYEFVPKPSDSALVIPPVKVGGLLFGYLPLLTHFKVRDLGGYDTKSIYGVLQILVTPIGRMAECKLQVYRDRYYNGVPKPVLIDNYVLNNELIDEEDKKFVPAVVDKQNTSATIFVYCSITDNGSVRIIDI